MGLVTCSKCKNVYDYDKYNGICPKCVRYNKETSATEDHQEYHNQYDAGYSHTVQDDHYSYHQKYDSNTSPHDSSKNKKSKVIIGIIICIFAINFIVPFFGVLLIPIAIGALFYYLRKKK